MNAGFIEAGLNDAYLMALDNIPLAMVITDPHLADNPIIYVNHAFETVTGHSRASAVGRNCRFLQGVNTNAETVSLIGRKLEAREEIATDILNYRADGSPFWNRLLLRPLNGKDGKLRYFMGVQRLLGSRSEAAIAGGTEDLPLREATHRVKNHLAMIVSLIRMQARAPSDDSRQDYANLARRVESLQLMYEEMSESEATGSHSEVIVLGDYIKRVVSSIGHLGGDSIQVHVDAEAVETPLRTASQIGLLLSEILSNAYRHAFTDRASGRIDVRLSRLDDTIRLEVVDDGSGIPTDIAWPESGSLGGRIVRSLTHGLDARLVVDRANKGTTVSLVIPVG